MPAQALNQPTVADLAGALDTLERGIESDGSIVAEQPSVWGQARLTMYRQEFENTMAKQLGNFQFTLQGSLSRSDQAYAADALALSATATAAGSSSNVPTPLIGNTTISPSVLSPMSSATGGSAGGGTATGAGGGGGGSGSPFGYDPSTTAFNAFAPGNFSRTGVNMLTPMGFVSPVPGSTALGAVSIEPTEYLNQMKRYIDYLHELRRMSDGDDTANAPGYSLNLLRIPVSVLPGRRTQQRYGAEITLSIKPHLNDELLPMTFHNLVVNDLLDEVGVPLTHVLNDVDWDDAMRALWKEIQNRPPVEHHTNFELFVAAVEKILDTRECDSNPAALHGLAANNYAALPHYSSSAHLSTQFTKLKRFLAVGSTSRLRTGQEAFPPSQIVDIYGADDWAEIVCAAWCTFWSDVPNKDVVHYPDVQSFLQQEVDASYNMLKLDEAAQGLWPFCNEALVDDIHGRKICQIANVRSNFEQGAKTLSQRLNKDPELTTALGLGDPRRFGAPQSSLVRGYGPSSGGAGGNFNLPPRGTWLPYFMPIPDQQAREAFNDYVRCRWPIHVFSLDPESDTQNISDSYSMRREMQLAMSLAFVSGNLSTNNLFQFARRLETDMETIALNKTQVGFSNGTDIFGWRFYPRFQSPDVENNCKAFFELVFGGPNRRQLLRQRQLDPGMRECVAIVLMPSFVPYADVDASSNWFALDNPRRKLMNSKKAIRLGEQVKMIENCSQFVGHTECYRDGDLERLLNRVKQLESRLPLQSMSVQVPYENTLGGFSMFNTGVTDLAPEVLGWYGAPAVNLDASTTLFLIGNHFSVHQTRVIIGGQEITNPELLSRQVMKVTIPNNAMALIEKNGLIAGGWTDTPNPFSEPTIADCCDLKPTGCMTPNSCEVPAQPGTESKPCRQMSGFELADDGPAASAPPSPDVPKANPSFQGRTYGLSTDRPTDDASGGYPDPNDVTGHVGISPATPSCAVGANDAKTWIQTPSHQTTNQNQAIKFPPCAITLHDPALHIPSLPPITLSLTAKQGTIILGKLNGLTFISGTNGSSSLAVRGNINDVQAALSGLLYVPKSQTAGSDVLTITLVGSGVNSQSTVNVAITVRAKKNDYYFVDVQMATPYGTTTHLLIPAAHLTATGSGPSASASAGTPSVGACRSGLRRSFDRLRQQGNRNRRVRSAQLHPELADNQLRDKLCHPVGWHGDIDVQTRRRGNRLVAGSGHRADRRKLGFHEKRVDDPRFGSDHVDQQPHQCHPIPIRSPARNACAAGVVHRWGECDRLQQPIAGIQFEQHSEHQSGQSARAADVPGQPVAWSRRLLGTNDRRAALQHPAIFFLNPQRVRKIRSVGDRPCHAPAVGAWTTYSRLVQACTNSGNPSSVVSSAATRANSAAMASTSAWLASCSWTSSAENSRKVSSKSRFCSPRIASGKFAATSGVRPAA